MRDVRSPSESLRAQTQARDWAVVCVNVTSLVAYIIGSHILREYGRVVVRMLTTLAGGK